MVPGAPPVADGRAAGRREILESGSSVFQTVYDDGFQVSCHVLLSGLYSVVLVVRVGYKV
jgi:hypothetical protein